MKPKSWLEQLAKVALTLVIVSLGWIMVVAARPNWLRFPSLAIEVLLVLGLLGSALILVSVVALRQTRD